MNQIPNASAPPPDTALVSGEMPGELYDPSVERAVSRRLKRARWRKATFVILAVTVAAAAAAAFTHANREILVAAVPAPPPPPAPVAAAPAVAAPALASSQSRPVAAPGDTSDPNKVQARIVVPSDPEPPAAAAVAPPPIQMQATPSAARIIPMSPPVAAAPAPVEAASGEDGVPPAGALGFAPLPPPRPQRAP